MSKGAQPAQLPGTPRHAFGTLYEMMTKSLKLTSATMQHRSSNWMGKVPRFFPHAAIKAWSPVCRMPRSAKGRVSNMEWIERSTSGGALRGINSIPVGKPSILASSSFAPFPLSAAFRNAWVMPRMPTLNSMIGSTSNKAATTINMARACARPVLLAPERFGQSKDERKEPSW
eukprot:CAMPEP_0177365574 /NCGR_PEP_ID=MMETSP0368-20130122/39397_1 /TAXON_ID=447022 ORGANISM="Scrippsiella hangoei-like, Strain SHHI-4" /NCGR_SAMPLE_ID=MMETSP0368 /ASSEMBLY_ACC=CAM_ASM_000363 /LENGTH=172 /DNA_ID=CAMNT_0018828513 /DNA_START=137 /DNA_END=655 /DNA_ORIENTATION=-